MRHQVYGQIDAQDEATRADCTEAVSSVFDETVALFLRLRALGEAIHDGSGLSGAMRGVLRDLEKLGPQTVPRLARRRPVTRQHIQAITNELQELGLVELIDNPAHKRSKLINLTPAGKQALQEIAEREADLLSRVEVPISASELEATSRTLVRLRQAMESEEWRRAVREMTNRHGADRWEQDDDLQDARYPFHGD